MIEERQILQTSSIHLSNASSGMLNKIVKLRLVINSSILDYTSGSVSGRVEYDEEIECDICNQLSELQCRKFFTGCWFGISNSIHSDNSVTVWNEVNIFPCLSIGNIESFSGSVDDVTYRDESNITDIGDNNLSLHDVTTISKTEEAFEACSSREYENRCLLCEGNGVSMWKGNHIPFVLAIEKRSPASTSQHVSSSLMVSDIEGRSKLSGEDTLVEVEKESDVDSSDHFYYLTKTHKGLCSNSVEYQLTDFSEIDPLNIESFFLANSLITISSHSNSFPSALEFTCENECNSEIGSRKILCVTGVSSDGRSQLRLVKGTPNSLALWNSTLRLKCEGALKSEGPVCSSEVFRNSQARGLKVCSSEISAENELGKVTQECPRENDAVHLNHELNVSDISFDAEAIEFDLSNRSVQSQDLLSASESPNCILTHCVEQQSCIVIEDKSVHKEEPLPFEIVSKDCESITPFCNKENDLCRICYANVIDCVLLPCAHLAVCVSCAIQLDQCPYDRQRIDKVLPVYRV